MLPLNNPSIGNVCLSGLIEDGSETCTATELKKFHISSVGQGFCFGRLENDACEIKLMNNQLCQLPSVTNCPSTFSHRDKRGDVKEGINVTDDDETHNSKNIADETEYMKVIRALTDVNREIMKKYYELSKEYEIAKAEKNKSSEELLELNQLYVEVLQNVEQFKLESEKLKNELGTVNARNVELEKQIEHLKVTNGIIRKTYEMRIQNLEKENEKLRKKQIETECNFEKVKRKSWEMCTEDLEIVKIRPLGAQSKPASYIKVPQVVKNASEFDINAKALKERVKVLHSTLASLAGKSPKACDLVSTLAQFNRQYPEIAEAAYQKSNSEMRQQTLTPGEALDLKVFLSIPMYNFRKLKQFLDEKGIEVLPSENKVREEMLVREVGKEVEVGVIEIFKKTKDTEKSKVAILRVKDLFTHISKSIASSPSVELFNSKILIKLGGDKGGSSTKLLYEIVSVSSVEIIMMYEGADCTDNLWETTGPLREDLCKLKNTTFMVHGKEAKASILLYGDYEFLCHVMGHQGASATYPCLHCLCLLSDLQAKNGQPHTPYLVSPDNLLIPHAASTYTARTIEQYQKDYKNNFDTDPENLHKNGKFNHSIVSPILIPPMDVKHIVPPSLHILLGLTLKFYNMLQMEVQLSDNPSEIQSKTDFMMKKSEKEEIEAKIEKSTQKTEAIDFARQKLGSRAKRGKGKCSSPKCFSYDDKFIECSTCNAQFHNKCIGTQNEEYEIYECFLCQGTDLHSHLESEAKKEIEILHNLSQSLHFVDESLKKMTTDLSNGMPARETQLADILSQLGVDRQAYHSMSFTGNHCVKILENAERLCSVLPENKDLFVELFTRFRDIYKLMAAKRILEQHEIQKLCTMCYQFGSWFPSKFPQATIPIKLHLLTHHVPEFVTQWRSLGLFSEQLLESVHAKANVLHRTFSSMRERPKQLHLVYSHLSMHAPASIKPVVPRKCKVCNGFLKKAYGVKKCPQCEPECFATKCT